MFPRTKLIHISEIFDKKKIQSSKYSNITFEGDCFDQCEIYSLWQNKKCTNLWSNIVR